jgi:hypothetical protein
MLELYKFFKNTFKSNIVFTFLIFLVLDSDTNSIVLPTLIILNFVTNNI